MQFGMGKSIEIGRLTIGICRDLTVRIRDNGRGFGGESFSYEAEFLATAKLGPLSLRERVRELGGQMGMTSSSKGVELQIKLPLT